MSSKRQKVSEQSSLAPLRRPERELARADDVEDDHEDGQDSSTDDDPQGDGDGEATPAVTKTFEQLGVVESLCEACKNLGYIRPTQIQEAAIPIALEGRDIVGLAETGSGKTAAFAIPIIQSLLDKPQPLHSLVLAPTRELATQIAQNFEALGALISLRVAVIVGGLDMVSQQVALSKKPHCIVATPGRLLDHLEKTKGFSLKNLKCLVLDEADRLLDMDFGDIITKILKFIPRERRTYLFSATLGSKVESLQRASLRDPVRVQISASKYQTVSTLKQQYLFIPHMHKDVYFIYTINEKAGQSVIVFARTVNETQRLAILLRTLGFGALALHGQLSQSARLGALNKFKAGNRDILVATDVAARGLDIPKVDVVINYDMPSDSKTYVHRVGRTARAGKSGVAISIVTQYDIELYQRIEAALGKQLPQYAADKEAVMVFKPRVEEAQAHARNEMKSLLEDRGKKGAVLKGRRHGKSTKRRADDMDVEER